MKKLLLIMVVLFGMVSSALAMQVVDIMSTLYEGQPAVAVIFDSPVDVKSNFDKFVNIDDHIKSKGIVDDGLQIIYYTNLENSQTYCVNVRKGLKGLKSAALEHDYSDCVEIPALTPSAWFSSKGMLIVPSNKAVLPITATNIDNVLVNFYKIPQESLDSSFDNLSNRSAWVDDIEYYLRGYKLVMSKAYSLDSINQQRIVNLDIPQELFSAAGVYAAVVQTPYPYYKAEIAYFMISDIGLQIREYETNKYEIWTRSLTTGAPMPDVTISYKPDRADDYKHFQTDKDGHASINTDMGIFLKAQKGEQVSVMDIRKKVDLSDFDTGLRYARNREIFIYGPRDLYRGGETLEYNVLIRDFDGKPVDIGPVELELISPKGQHLNKLTVMFDKDYGYYRYSYKLPSNAATGQWELFVRTLYDGYYYQNTHYLSVEDFMPETMRLTLGTPGESSVTDLESALSLNILGEYLYGAPASHSTVDGYFNIRPAVELSEKWKGYRFGNDNNRAYRSLNNYIYEFNLDEAGRGFINILNEDEGTESLVSTYEDNLMPMRVQYYISLYESGGRSIMRAKEYFYLPSGEAIGIKPGFEGNGTESSDNIFYLINIDKNSNATPANVFVTLMKEERSYYWDYDGSNGWRYKYTSASYPVYQEQLSIGKTAKELALRTTGWGYYKLIVKNVSTGQTMSYDFQSGEDWWWDEEIPSSLSTKPESLSILLDKPAYKEGDSAKITITSPYDGKGMVIVDARKGALWKANIEVKNNKATLQIPVGTDERWQMHDAYITAFISRPESTVEKTQKSVVFGVQHLPIDRKNRKIELDVSHPYSIKPGADFEVVVKAKDKSKYSKNALVTLAAVDQGILSVKAFETPDAWKFFFEKRSHYADIADNFWQVIHKQTDKMATRYGGDEEIAMKGGDLARADVKLVSYFTQPVLLDENGEARIPMNVEDFNGELRLMAMAFNKDSYGSKESTMKVVEEVVTELSMPRFLATGDKVDLTLDVRNMSDSAKQIELEITATEPLKMADKYYSKISLQKSEKQTVKIPVEAVGTEGYATINLKVKYGKDEINKKWRLAVRPPYPAVTGSQTVTIHAGATENLLSKSFSDYIANSVSVNVAISTLPVLGLSTYFQGLLTYPYGCLEQTVSSTYPLLYATPDIRKKYGLGWKYEETPETLVAYGISRIAEKQLSNGSFGYWSSDSSESQWGTVYAAEFLNEASALGYAVPKPLLESANKRLVSYIRSQSNPSYIDSYSDSSYYRFSVRAYAGYVLAKAGQAPLSDLRQLYTNNVSQIEHTPIPAMHLAVAFKLAGDPAKAEEAYKRAIALGIKKSYGYYGDYSSAIRDRAWMIRLMKEYGEAKHSEIVDELMELTLLAGKRSWMSTQEKIRLFQSAISLDDGSQVKGTITAGGKTINVDETGTYTLTLRKHDARDIKFTSSTDGTLYAMVDFIGYTLTAPDAYSINAVINRSYFDLDGNSIDLKNVKTGDYVLVRLTYKIAYRTIDGLIVDLLPAGFEIENQNLDNTIKLTNLKNIPNKDFASPMVMYKEYRDDRFVSAVQSTGSSSESAEFYIMRAVTPGTFVNPPPYIEDMYRPNIRALGISNPPVITIIPK